MLNEEFHWEKESLVIDDPTIGPFPEIKLKDVKDAPLKMKRGKATGSSGVAAEMLLAPGELGIERLTKLFNKILQKTKYLKKGIRVS